MQVAEQITQVSRNSHSLPSTQRIAESPFASATSWCSTSGLWRPPTRRWLAEVALSTVAATPASTKEARASSRDTQYAKGPASFVCGSARSLVGSLPRPRFRAVVSRPAGAPKHSTAGAPEVSPWCLIRTRGCWKPICRWTGGDVDCRAGSLIAGNSPCSHCCSPTSELSHSGTNAREHLFLFGLPRRTNVNPYGFSPS